MDINKTFAKLHKKVAKREFKKDAKKVSARIFKIEEIKRITANLKCRDTSGLMRPNPPESR